MPPLPILESFQLAFYLDTEEVDPVPTAFSRQFHPFSFPSVVTVSELLSSNFERNFPFGTSHAWVPGPPDVGVDPPPEPAGLVPSALTAMGGWIGTSSVSHDPDGIGNRDCNHTSDLQLENASSRTSQHHTVVATESRLSTKLKWGNLPSISNQDDFFDFEKWERDEEARCSGAKRNRSQISNSSGETYLPVQPKRLVVHRTSKHPGSLRPANIVCE